MRLYLEARTHREKYLGGDTIDTATIYNNLGCCMFLLERNEEAKAYFELSNAIFECEVGSNHERTLVTSRNLLKVSRTSLNHVPEYR